MLSRWIVFNAVGALGVVVQLGLLAVLVRGIELNYLLATAVAVEATLLHNFIWHQRWTWRDRPVRSVRSVADRLVRFHLLNGAISFGGNLAVMAWLTGVLGIDPLLANTAAILLCSVVNFAAGHTLVFRFTDTTYEFQPVPEPLSVLTLGAGLAVLWRGRRGVGRPAWRHSGLRTK